MPPKKQGTLWNAPPHTIAKIKILEGYLDAWFRLFGRIAVGQDLLFVDGFAGPGTYTNHSTGSPIAALRSGIQARAHLGANWRAGTIHFVFIESDRKRFDHLTRYLRPFMQAAGIRIHLIRSTFVSGLPQVKQTMPQFFERPLPMFVFIDPFGATGAPFHLVHEILGSRRSEVLINFDADAVGRIFRAGADASHEARLTEIFGNDSWKELSVDDATFENQCRMAVQLYKNQLRSIQNVDYVFSFEMLNGPGTIGYDLIFASQHPRGLEKMKEAMKRIDQRGDFTFSDAHVGQQTLFRFDDPTQFADLMSVQFKGTDRRLDEVVMYALNETPFVTPTKMLKLLEDAGRIDVIGTGISRRRGTYNSEAVSRIRFL